MTMMMMRNYLIHLKDLMVNTITKTININKYHKSIVIIFQRNKDKIKNLLFNNSINTKIIKIITMIITKTNNNFNNNSK